MAVSRCHRSLFLVALVVVSTAALGVFSSNVRGTSVRGPILIDGDSGFTAANGVVSGSGTAADPFVIEGWDIDATASDGISVRNTTAAFVIREVTVHSSGQIHNGIVLANVSSVTVLNATLSHVGSGMIVRSSGGVTLKGNAVTQNSFDGIAIFGSRNVTLNGNNITYNGDGVSVQDSTSVLLQGNAIWLNSQDGAFLTNVTDVGIQASAFSSNGWAGLHLSEASNVTIVVNLVFSNGRDGIAVDTTTGLLLRSNTAFSNQGGIRLYNVETATVALNDLSANRDSGIIVESSRGVSISQNLVSASGYGGIVVGSVTDVVADGNRVSNSDYGLSFLLVSRATIRSNNVTLSRQNGIYFAGTDNLTVERNNATRNANGIAVEATADAVLRSNVVTRNDRGIYLFRSVRAIVAGNQFDSNSIQAIDDTGPANRWDDGYPVGGNFWSDFHGVDRCNGPNQSVCDDPDGIGDVPYDIDTDSLDQYPLRRPPGSPNEPPVASFVIQPETGNATTSFTLNASAAYDVEDSAAMLELRWDFDGNGVWDTPWTHDRSVGHIFSQPGDYLVRLEVRDSTGLTNTTDRNVRVAVLSGSPSLLAFDAVALALLLLAAATVAIGLASYYRWRRKRPVARPAWRLPPRPRR